jgi:membrane-associated phospholipid phosphatase
MKIIKPDLLDYLGFYGPVILFCSTIILYIYELLLIPSSWLNSTFYVLLFYIANRINSLFNYRLKSLIKEPRPSKDINIFNPKQKTHHNNNHLYGMPSGHSQTCGFITVFTYLIVRNIWVLIFYLFISFNTMRQRIKYYNHTLGQVSVGFPLGCLIGYILYKITEKLKPTIMKGISSLNQKIKEPFHGHGGHGGGGHGGGGNRGYYGGRGYDGVGFGTHVKGTGGYLGSIGRGAYLGNGGWGDTNNYFYGLYKNMCYDNNGNIIDCLVV